MRVNDSMIVNDFFIANLLLSVVVKNFEDRLEFGKAMAKIKWQLFFPDTMYITAIKIQSSGWLSTVN